MIRALAPLLAAAALVSPAQADERTWMISGFDRIRVDAPVRVKVTTGASPKARVSGDRRAVERIAVRVDGRTLIVTRDVNAPPAAGNAPLDPVEVTVPALVGAAVVGAGSLEVDRMRGARVDLSLGGGGSLSVARVDADRLVATLIGNGSLAAAGAVLDARFQSNGAGSIDAEKLLARDLFVSAQGAGSGRYAARDTAEVIASGNGPVTVAGSPTCTVRASAPVTCGKGGASGQAR